MNDAQLERFLAQIIILENGCWEWTGALLNSGYGSFSAKLEDGTRETVAHRVAYRHWIGPIPLRHTIDHTCHNESDCLGGRSCPHRRCENPDHLEAVTNRENSMR